MQRSLNLLCATAIALALAPAAGAADQTKVEAPQATTASDAAAGALKQADERKVPAPFRGKTTASPIRIDYRDWSAILHNTVIDGGRSTRDFAASERPEIGTRLTIGDRNSFRNEGNRLNFREFKGQNLAVISRIRHELEQLPGIAPMASWTKNEQLAYWLNLYNITVVEQIAKAYPVRRLRKLRFGSSRHASVWDQKLLTVAGVPLSLHDIRAILVGKWDTTLVAYGLFQGYVGGPNIPTQAYTADNVHHLLLKNAREFVNSNRGTQMRGSTLVVSDFYKRNADLFPDFDTDLRAHLMHLSDPGWRAKIAHARHIRTKLHDYYIADVYGGGEQPHSATNTNSAALIALNVVVKNGGGIATQSFEVYTGGANYKTAPIERRFPPAAMHYIQKIKAAKALKPGHVTLEEMDSSARDRMKGAPAKATDTKTDTPADTPARAPAKTQDNTPR